MKKEVIEELKRLEKKYHGLPKPEEIVKEARPASSPLHEYFEWDNSKAGYQHRLWQARVLLISARYKAANGRKMRVFVSLSTDRVKKGGGYRLVENVLLDEDLKLILLKDARREMEYFIQKYEALQELAEVIEAMKKVIV